MALGSEKINFPTMKKTKIYKKPGVYLSGLALRVPWRYAAVEVLACAPSEFLSSVLAIDVPCLCLAPRAQFQHGREARSFAGMPLRLGISPRTAFSMRQRGNRATPAKSGRQLSTMRGRR